MQPLIVKNEKSQPSELLTLITYAIFRTFEEEQVWLVEQRA
jgi:hypothetical protein